MAVNVCETAVHAGFLTSVSFMLRAQGMRIGKRLAQMLDPSIELFPESERLDFAQEEVWHPDCVGTSFGIPKFEDIAARAHASKPLAVTLDEHQVSLLSLHVLFEFVPPLPCL